MPQIPTNSDRLHHLAMVRIFSAKLRLIDASEAATSGIWTAAQVARHHQEAAQALLSDATLLLREAGLSAEETETTLLRCGFTADPLAEAGSSGA